MTISLTKAQKAAEKAMKEAHRLLLASLSTDLERTLYSALEEAHYHLDYCGYGNKWERECAAASGLPKTIEDALALAASKMDIAALEISIDHVVDEVTSQHTHDAPVGRHYYSVVAAAQAHLENLKKRSARS